MKPTTAEKTLIKLRERILRLKRIRHALESGQSSKTTKVAYYAQNFSLESIDAELAFIKGLLTHVIEVL